MLPCKSIHNKIKDELSNKYFYPIIASNVYIYNNTNTISRMPKGLSFALNYLEDSYHFDYITLEEVKDLQERLEYLLRMKNHNDYWNEIIDSIKQSRSYNIHINGLRHFQLCDTDYTKNLIKYIKDCDYALQDEFIRLINNSVTKKKFLTSIFHDMYYGYGNDNYVLTDYYKISKLYEKLIIENKQFDYNKVREEFMDKNSTDKNTDTSKINSKDDKQELADIVADKVEERIKEYLPKQINPVKNNESTNATPFIKARISNKNGLATVLLGYKDIVCLCSIPASAKNDETYFIIYKAGSGKGLISSNISKEEFNNLKNLGLPYCTNWN